MNASEFSSAVAQRLDMKIKDVDMVIAASSVILAEQLAAGGEVVLRDIGTFKITIMKARTGRNPRTGEKIQIPAKSSPKFRPATKLSRSV